MTSLELQRTLEASLDKRTKDTLGPPIGKQLAVFIDDINMPHPDKYVEFPLFVHQKYIFPIQYRFVRTLYFPITPKTDSAHSSHWHC